MRPAPVVRDYPLGDRHLQMAFVEPFTECVCPWAPEPEFEALSLPGLSLPDPIAGRSWCLGRGSRNDRHGHPEAPHGIAAMSIPQSDERSRCGGGCGGFPLPSTQFGRVSLRKADQYLIG